MRSLSLALAVVGFSLIVNQASAQVVTVKVTEGSQASYIAVEGTVDVKIAPVSEVLVYPFLNGKKEGPVVKLTVDLNGKWGTLPNGLGTNVTAPGAVSGSTITVLVQAVVNAGTKYNATGSGKAK